MSGLHIFSFLCMYMQIVASVCLCVCVCVCVCVCMCACVCVCVCTCVHVCERQTQGLYPTNMLLSFNILACRHATDPGVSSPSILIVLSQPPEPANITQMKETSYIYN